MRNRVGEGGGEKGGGGIRVPASGCANVRACVCIRYVRYTTIDTTNDPLHECYMGEEWGWGWVGWVGDVKEGGENMHILVFGEGQRRGSNLPPSLP